MATSTVSIAVPTLKLGARDAAKVEQRRALQASANKAELSGLREQVAALERALETKQETDRAAVEQLLDVAEVAKLHAAVAGMEKNEKEISSEVEHLKLQVQTLDAAADAASKASAEPLIVVDSDQALPRKLLESSPEALRKLARRELAGLGTATYPTRMAAQPIAIKPTAKPATKLATKGESIKGEAAIKPELGLCNALLSCFKPPPVEAAPVEPDYNGCYLLFTEVRGGAFITHWSESKLPEGSVPLAYYKPGSPVAKFKYAHGGQTELCRGVGGPNKKLFFQGWASFLRAAYGQNGTLTFLHNVGACPVAIFLCTSEASVLRLQMGSPIKLTSDIVAVAVTPPLATGLDVLKMPTRMFQAVGEKAGAAFSLDGGGDGKAEDVAESLSRSRSLLASSPCGAPLASEGSSPRASRAVASF